MNRFVRGSISDITADIKYSGYTGNDTWWIDENGKNWWNRTTKLPVDAVYFVMDGFFDMKYNGQTIRVTKNQLVYLKETGDAIDFCLDESVGLLKYYCNFELFFSNVKFGKMIDAPCAVDIDDPEEQEYLREEFESLCQNSSSTSLDKKMRSVSALLNILSVYIKRSNSTLIDVSDPEMLKVVDYLEKNFTKKISVSEIAELCGYSTDHFCKKFKAHFGCTPVKYINGMKIRKSKELLSSTDMSITEVAYAVGMEDSAYFSNLFRKHTGVYPSRFRLMSKENR